MEKVKSVIIHFYNPIYKVHFSCSLKDAVIGRPYSYIENPKLKITRVEVIQNEKYC